MLRNCAVEFFQVYFYNSHAFSLLKCQKHVMNVGIMQCNPILTQNNYGFMLIILRICMFSDEMFITFISEL